MVEKKTAALFGCALGLGGLAGGADDATVEGLVRAGRELGVAFQMTDDALGVWGSEERTGKRPAADIRDRKKSLPVVYALSRTEGEELSGIYARLELSDGDITRVIELLDACGARERCAQAAEERLREGLALLDGLPLDAGAVSDLREAAEFLVRRDY
jgi:geranylgeranyl diphosphate synthase type I